MISLHIPQKYSAAKYFVFSNVLSDITFLP